MEVTNPILTINYKELPISNSLKRFFSVHQISTLDKLLEIKPIELMKMKWFNSHLLYELLDLCEKQNIKIESKF